MNRTHQHADSDAIRTDVAPGATVAPGRDIPSASLAADRPVLHSGLVQRKAARDDNGVAAGADDAVAAAASSSGAPLPGELRERFETSLGADLSGVRVHTGAESAAAASAVGARAYATGNDIHFAAGAYDPASTTGQHLLAHEVAHTVQQQGGPAVRQHKLEVSTPGDAAEVEADRAADAMVSGAPAQVGGHPPAVLRRDPFGPGTGDPFGLGAPAAGPMPLGGPIDPALPTIGPFAPNVDANGVPYDIPTVEYTSQASAAAPPLDAAMPHAEVKDPGAIPGWKTIRPARVNQIGPFVLTEPASEYIVHGPLHSKMATDAWAAYKNELIPDVKSAWDSDARGKLDSYTQEAKGNADLDKLVAETKKSYNVAVKPGAGTVSEQGGAQQVTPGTTVQQAADKVTAGGTDVTQGAAATGAQPEDTTVSGPVKAAVDKLNAKREFRSGQLKQLGGLHEEMSAEKTGLQAAEAELQEWKDKKAEEEEKKKDPHFELAKKLAGDMHPKLKGIVATVEKYKEPLKKMQEIGTAGVKAYTKADPQAALDVVMGLVDLAKWQVLQSRIAELGPALGNPKLTAIKAAHGKLTAIANQAIGLSTQIQATLKQEKALYDEVAAQMEKHWKGKNPGDAKIAADALRAIPTVDRLLVVLREMKGAMPKPPSSSTRAAQGYALATQGVGAPGAADLLKVAGWILGAPAAIGPEITKWEGVRAQLQSVATAVGIE